MLDGVQNAHLQVDATQFLNSNNNISLTACKDGIIAINYLHLKFRSVNCVSMSGSSKQLPKVPVLCLKIFSRFLWSNLLWSLFSVKFHAFRIIIIINKYNSRQNIQIIHSEKSPFFLRCWSGVQVKLWARKIEHDESNLPCPAFVHSNYVLCQWFLLLIFSKFLINVMHLVLVVILQWIWDYTKIFDAEATV